MEIMSFHTHFSFEYGHLKLNMYTRIHIHTEQLNNANAEDNN